MSKTSKEEGRPWYGWTDELGRFWTKPSDIFRPGYSDPCPPELQKIYPHFCWPTPKEIERANEKE